MKVDAALKKDILKHISFVAVSYAESLDPNNSHEDRQAWGREFAKQAHNLADAIIVALGLAEESLDHLIDRAVVEMGHLQDDDPSQFN